MADQLTKDQLNIIRLIEKEAIKAGLDPDFALAVAQAESAYRHIPATDTSSTAFGPFQVNKPTAKTLGVDYEAMVKDPKLAVQAGIQNLLSHANNPKLEGDPARIIAAHHWGADSPFASTGDLKHLNKEHANYIAGIGELLPTGEFPETVLYTKSSEPEAAKDEVADESSDEGDIYGGKKVTEYETNTQTPPSETGAVAGAVGAAVGAFKAPVWSLAHRLSKLLPSGEKISPEAAVKLAETIMDHDAARGITHAGGAIPSDGPDGGRLAKGQTGTMPYNYGKAAGLTDIEAAQAVDMTKNTGGVHDLSEKRRQGLRKVNEIAPNQFVENPRFGGLLTQTQGAGSGPRESFVMDAEGKLRAVPKAPPVSATPPPVQAPVQGPSGLSRFTRKIAGSAPVVGGLAAYGAGYGAQDVYNRIMADKPGEAALSALGTAASAAAPFVSTAASIPLAGAGALIPAYLQMQDDPEAKAKFLKGMSGKGAYANRGFGLD